MRNTSEAGKRTDETGRGGETERVGQIKRAPWAPGESALVSPVPIEEGLAQTLGAGLMEPLQAAPALQHFQVPPDGAHRTSDLQILAPITAPNPDRYLLPYPSLFFLLHSLGFSTSPHRITRSLTPAPHYSLPGTTTVTVALLPVTQMSSVPVQPLQSIWQR